MQAARPTHTGMTPVDLMDRCRPMAIRMVPHMLERATGHDETIRQPL